MNRNPPAAAPPQAQGSKRASIDLTLYIKAAKELGYDSRKTKKGTPEYTKIMALKQKMKAAMDKA
jgi:hypothetical protein